MPVIAEKVETIVFEALRNAYDRKHGGSPSVLQKVLDQKFEDELRILNRGKKGAEGTSLISDKTLRNFFSSENPQMKEQYLNYLCVLLLDLPSYKDAVEKLATQTSNLDLNIQDFPWWQTYQKRIEEKCGSTRIPHMTKPIPVKDLYVTTEVSEEIQERRRKTASQLQAEIEGKAPPEVKRVQAEPLLESSTRLMLWGRGGSGKTTFLKHIALERVQNHPVTQIPVFIELRNLVKHRVEIQTLADIATREILRASRIKVLDVVKTLLDQGKFIFLIDGLDEVKPYEQEWIANLVAEGLDTFPRNSFIISCRPANVIYIDPSFKDVEMVSFTREQIDLFVKNWFKTCDEEKLDEMFLSKLDESPHIEDMAKTPLLLTQLCSIYQYGYDFPNSRSALLEDAVDLYLRKWDSFRRIERQTSLNHISKPRLRNLFTHIAYQSMTQQQTSLSKTQLISTIESYMAKLNEWTPNQETLDSDILLKDLESAYGIVVQETKDEYGFVHKSFQEYLLSQDILEQLKIGKVTIEELFQKHLLDRSWRSSMVSIAEGLSDASNFLTELFSFSLNLISPELQEILEWLDRITTKAEVPTSAWRACVLSFDLETDMHINRLTKKLDHAEAQRLAEKTRALNQRYGQTKPRTPLMELLLNLAVIHAVASDKNIQPDKLVYIERIKRYDLSYGLENIGAKLQEALSTAKDLQLNELVKDLENLNQNLPSVPTGEAWTEWAKNLQKVMQDHLDEGSVIELDPLTTSKLNDLIYVTSLILDCLLGDISCDVDLRKGIFNSLLLPSNSEKIPVSLHKLLNRK